MDFRNLLLTMFMFITGYASGVLVTLGYAEKGFWFYFGAVVAALIVVAGAIWLDWRFWRSQNPTSKD